MIPPPRTPPDDTARAEADQAHADAIRAAVDAAVAGDRDAFGQAWAAYQLDVYRFVYYRVATRHLAEDLTSETCLRAMRRIETFSWQGRDFGAWLVTIARNLIADHFKAARHRFEQMTPDGEMRDAGPAAPSTEAIVLAAITHAEIHAAIDDLNPHQRACITARFLDQLSVAETAALLGKKEGATKTLQYRAVRALGRDPRLTPETTA